MKYDVIRQKKLIFTKTRRRTVFRSIELQFYYLYLNKSETAKEVKNHHNLPRSKNKNKSLVILYIMRAAALTHHDEKVTLMLLAFQVHSNRKINSKRFTEEVFIPMNSVYVLCSNFSFFSEKRALAMRPFQLATCNLFNLCHSTV